MCRGRRTLQAIGPAVGMNDALLRPADATPVPRVMSSYEQCQPYPAPYEASAGSALDASASALQPHRRQYLSVAMAGLSVLTMGGLCFGFDSCASHAAVAQRSRALAAVRRVTAAEDLSLCSPLLLQAVPGPVRHGRLLRRLHRRRARHVLVAPIVSTAREVLRGAGVYFRRAGLGVAVCC